MTVRDVKMFLTVSRDSSTDKQQKANSVLINSTLSDKKVKSKNSNYYLPSETRTKFLTFCQFPDLPIEFCEKKNALVYCLITFKYQKNHKIGHFGYMLGKRPGKGFLGALGYPFIDDVIVINHSF